MNISSEKNPGALYMVATPIGNLEDITLRALRILKEVDLIAAEDTRHSRILLSTHDIKTPLISLHEHNEKERSANIVSRIRDGQNVAYISDAGTPCISDPGYLLVSAALKNQIRVIPVPGPSALIAALSVCGFSVDQFVFFGFMPPRENKRRRFLETLRKEEKPIVFYESPSRIIEMLQSVYDVLGDRPIVVLREMTKVFEEMKQGLISEIIPQIAAGKAKGEFTVILQSVLSEPVALPDSEIQQMLLSLWAEKPISLRDAVAEVVQRTGLPKKKIYDLAIKSRQNSRPK